MKNFRGPLPLDDRDFAEVRGNVLAKIERRPSPVIAWALAAAAAIALIAIVIPRPQSSVAPHPVPLRGTDLSPGRGGREAAGEGPVQIAEKPKPPKKKKSRPQQPKRELVADKGAPPSDEEITMNIQTADPNIRIIWIARR